MGSESIDQPRVLLVENIHPGAGALLEKAGFEVEAIAHAPGEAELIERLVGVDVLGIRSGTQVSATVLAHSELSAIGAFCIGTNQVDLLEAARRGVAVFNAPFSNTRSVVELVIAEIIALTRRLTVKDREMHAGVWNKSATGAHEVRGRNLGIVGYGNIGSQLSVVAEALGMMVWFYDTRDRLAMGNARRCSTLDELLEVSDIVSLHVDGRPDNQGLFGDHEFERMRPGALLLNLSRGFVLDGAALRRHLVSGRLAGAAVDVFGDEPRSRDEAFVSELRGLDNVILTPHVGGSTEEAQEDIGRFVSQKLSDYLRTGSTALSVNLPNLELPERAGTHRLILIHRNVPGVLAAINATFARYQVNIEGQFLATRGDIGYVITDVAVDPDEQVLGELAAMEATVELRVAGRARFPH